VAPQKRVKVWAVRNSATRGIFVGQAGEGRLEDEGRQSDHARAADCIISQLANSAGCQLRKEAEKLAHF
jgi:hypothetical protein